MQVWKLFHVRSGQLLKTLKSSKNIFRPREGNLHCKCNSSWILTKVQYNKYIDTSVQDRTTIISYNQNKSASYKRKPMKFLLTPRRFREVMGELWGTTAYLVGTDPLIRYLFGWIALPVSADVNGTALLSKHFSSKCTEHNVADFDGTKSFLWTLTNRVHFFRKVSSFGK